MHRYPECAASLAPSINGLDLALQRALVDVPADAVVDLDNRRHGALAETGDGTDRELVVRRGLQDLFAVALRRFFQSEAELEARALQQVARAAGVAGGPTADADGVITLRLQVEEGVERGDAIDPRQGDFGL